MENELGIQKFVCLMEKADFSKVSSGEKMAIIKSFIKNPNFAETDLYFLGLLKPSEKIERPLEKRSDREPCNSNNCTSSMEVVVDHSDSEAEAEESQCLKFVHKQLPSIASTSKEPQCLNSVLKQLASIELPPNLKKRIKNLKGSEVLCVMEKKLEESDIRCNNGRLSLPCGQINPLFLTPRERQFLKSRTGPRTSEIRLQLIQPCGEVCAINLRQWNMNTPTYNLVTSWNSVVRRNSLYKGMMVQLWSFRVNAKLWLALVEAGRDIQL